MAIQKPKLSEEISPTLIAQKVVAGIYDGISTSEIDELASEIAASRITHHPDYGKLSARIVISNLHKNTIGDFLETMETCYKNRHPQLQKDAPQISLELLELARKYKHEISQVIDYSRDYTYTYFGIKTLTRAYLKQVYIDGKSRVIERPQDMLMRVSLGIWKDDLNKVFETYHRMSNGEYTHATPTLFNAGTLNGMLSSCFLIANKDDSLDGIMDTYKETAKISGAAGGIGLSIHDVRADGSYIAGSGGRSNGIMPYLKTANELSRYWDQGGGKRKGSFAIYLEPWHADIFTLLDIRKNHGKEEMRARDLFPALWIPDLFMERVEQDGTWTLMCPNECPNLFNVYGKEFNSLYTKYESEGKGRKTIQARVLWDKILECQIETGTPYMLYKDAANEKSNQKNLGTIRSSNLCTEIIEYSSPEETAVCNLASIALPSCIENGEFNFNKLADITEHTTESLDAVIDATTYPTESARRSNERHRPIGIGVQGLADVFAILRLPFDSQEARKLNRDIFETIYFSALTASSRLARGKGCYRSYVGSPASEGKLQYDLWGKADEVEINSRWDWRYLKSEIGVTGLRNSLLVAPMPTASTAQILGNNEAFEPFTSNMYLRRTLSGEFIVVNNHLLNDLFKLGLWDDEMKNAIQLNKGSVQGIDRIPEDIQILYRTAYELSMKSIIDMAVDRAIFIDQSQSMNLFMIDPNPSKMTSMHFYGWKNGLKTGMYYLRTKAAVDAIQFTVKKESANIEVDPIKPEEFKQMLLDSKSDDDDCLMCSS